MAKAGAEVAKERGILGECGKMCDTCAFKWDQERSLMYLLAADDAAYQLMSEGKFNCHTHDFKMADRPCAGFILAKLAFEPEINDDNAAGKTV